MGLATAVAAAASAKEEEEEKGDRLQTVGRAPTVGAGGVYELYYVYVAVSAATNIADRPTDRPRLPVAVVLLLLRPEVSQSPAAVAPENSNAMGTQFASGQSELR